MRVVFGACAVALGLAVGCRTAAPAPEPRPSLPTVTPIVAELPLVKAARIEVSCDRLAPTPIKPTAANAEAEYRRITEPVCQALGAQHVPLANTLDEEARAPGTCDASHDKLKQALRAGTAMELRNRAAADALERFFQLASAEEQTALLRDSFPLVDDLHAKAKAARAANVRFPLAPADLERQRGQMLTQLEQAEAGSALLNIDLKRRIGQPPSGPPLWPSGDFAVDAGPVNAERAVTVALADRPELRGLRALHAGLTPDTLPLAREQLRNTSPLLGAAPVPLRGLSRFLLRHRGPSAETLAELDVRKKQLADLIEARERAIADETRAAVVSLTAQTRRVQLARDRQDAWATQRADAIKKREATQPGAELHEAQVSLEWLKARAEVVSEVMAWHQARVRLKAAQGRFAWERLDAGAR